jgi:hypothetical protein
MRCKAVEDTFSVEYYEVTVLAQRERITTDKSPYTMDNVRYVAYI